MKINFLYDKEKDISIESYLKRYQKEWDSIANEYQNRAEKIFGASIPESIVGYFTINNRCP